MKKSILNVMILLSCNGNQFNYESITGHTFYQLTKKESDIVLYKPCDANYISYKIKKDYIIHNLGQEYDTIKQLKIKQISSKEILVEGFNTNTSNAERIIFKEIENKKRVIIEINENKYIDSIHSNNVIKLEQPCKECYNACN